MQVFRLVAALILLVSSVAPGFAIDLRRGLVLDTWTSWPDRTNIGIEKDARDFPEWMHLVSPQEIRAIRKAGFDFVRLPIDPSVFLYHRSPAKTQNLLTGVVSAIHMLRQADLNVIVDVHSIPNDWSMPSLETYLKSEEALGEYLSVIADIGRAIASEDPDHVAFEPINEPTFNCRDQQEEALWDRAAHRVFATAEASAPRLAIIMQGACNGSAGGLAAMDPRSFGTNNVIWSFHSFEPRIFTLQGASWIYGAEPFIQGLSYPPDQQEKTMVRDRALRNVAASEYAADQKPWLLQKVAQDLDAYFDVTKDPLLTTFQSVDQWADTYDVPAKNILVGEFGMNMETGLDPKSANSRLRYLSRVRQIAEKRGWGWAVWGWSGPLRLVESDNNRKFVPALTKALGFETSSN